MQRLLVLAAAVLALAALAQVAVPAEEGLTVAGHPVPSLCPAAAAGGACPGCGLTRAGISLLRGDLPGAWRFHPGIFPLALLALLLVLRRRLDPRREAQARHLAAALLLLAAAARSAEFI